MKLEVNHLSVRYDTDVILHDLSLCVADGEFLSLLGPSGCGKSTLIQSIAGILPVQSGNISLDNREITHLPVHKRGTVIVFQDMRLFPHQNIVENVAFPLKMQGISKKIRLQKAEELLEKVQMADYKNRKPSELSGGQQQRVALARALAAKPKLLLLDEPFSALDENLREDMRNLVLQLQQEFHMTVILVTHDREEALCMSNRIALMFDGAIIQIGTPHEIYHCPVNRQVADYFGDCVYITGSVVDGRFTGSGIACTVEVPDGNYQLMLRPSNLQMTHSGDYRLTVENISFRGSDTLLTLRAEDGTVWKKSYSNTVPWNTGDTVSANLTIPHAVLFPI